MTRNELRELDPTPRWSPRPELVDQRPSRRRIIVLSQHRLDLPHRPCGIPALVLGQDDDTGMGRLDPPRRRPPQPGIVEQYEIPLVVGQNDPIEPRRGEQLGAVAGPIRTE